MEKNELLEDSPEQISLANDASLSMAIRPGRNASIVSVLMVVVSVSGYLREATLAARFGLSTTMDAYFSAVFIPTMVYVTLIAGMLSPVFIPILLQDQSDSDNDQRGKLSETFSVVTNLVLLFLAVFVAVAVVTATKWLPVLFPGFSPETMEVTRRLIYIIFPSILFVALAGILTATLNAFHKFALPAIAPALSSVAVVIAALLVRGSRAIFVVAIATAVGFLLQLLLLIPAIGSLGIRYRPILSFRHPAVGKLVRLGGPLLLYLLVANASQLLERNLASRLSAGAVSTVSYATRLFTVPSNFLAAPLAIVAYPQFAREALRENWGNLSSQVTRMFRLVIFIFLPVTLWTVLNALPLTRLLYERGQFGFADSILTSRVLSFYGLGILPIAISVILLPCFYAIQDTLTPLWIECVNLVFYLVVAVFLMQHFGLLGLASSRGIQFYLFTAMLVFVVYRRGLLKIDSSLFRFVLRVGVASTAMALISWLTFYPLRRVFDSGNTPLRLGVVGVLLVVSGAGFLGIARLLNLTEVQLIVKAGLEMLSLPQSASGNTEDPSC